MLALHSLVQFLSLFSLLLLIEKLNLAIQHLSAKVGLIGNLVSVIYLADLALFLLPRCFWVLTSFLPLVEVLL